jgi:23S rRNA (guanine745-N1)-methyltransferase
LTLRHLADGLRCPFCFSSRSENRPLSPAGAFVAGCEAGHRFDVNKRGYISLLPPAGRVTGDSQVMLDARARFFDTGNYDPIADAVASACVAASAPQTTGQTPPDAADGTRDLRLAEIGCGTGFYLSAAVAALGGAGRTTGPIAADLSPSAVRMAVRAVPGAAGVVLDVWQPLPLLDSTLDGIVSVFAPRNLSEFARVLAPGGFLVAVVPTTRHLHQVRADGLAIGIPDGKPEALTEAAARWFGEVSRRLVEFEMELSGTDLDNLIGMGPSAHHAASQSASARADSERPVGENGNDTGAARRVTASVTVLTYRLARSA